MMTTLTLWWPATAPHVSHHPAYQLVTYKGTHQCAIQYANQQSNLQVFHLLSRRAAHPSPHRQGCWQSHQSSKPLHPRHPTPKYMTYIPIHLESPVNLQLATSSQPTHFPLLNLMMNAMTQPQDSPPHRDAPSDLSILELHARSPAKLYFTSLTSD